MNRHAIGHLPLRDGAHLAHADAEHRSPVLSTSLYFVVFGAAIGSRMGGRRRQLRRLHRPRPGHAVAADAEHLQRVLRHLLPKFTGTIYELLSAPVSTSRSCSAYVGAAATKSIMLG
jgi:ABC-2 type transport system permease protein